MKKILVVLTGGTICSSVNPVGKRYSDANNVKIINHFKNGNSNFCNAEFDSFISTDILSENMTASSWNKILSDFKKINFDLYCGIIVLHGTDTLAYTSSLFSLLLAGCKIPVCMVSSQLPLEYKNTNGHDNFRASVELIMNGINPNVYVVYKNSDGEIYVHYGCHLLQCANYSNDFFSRDMKKLTNFHNCFFEGKTFETNSCLINKIDKISCDVLSIVPYVGINYSVYNLDSISAVLHGTYHSETVCAEQKNNSYEQTDSSVISLIDKCKKTDIDFFLSPCSPDSYNYESTGHVLEHGAKCINNVTFETAYAKLVIGCSMGLKGDELYRFVQKSINYEASSL
ncbi:MAG: asparaginase [Clostridia bacterium]|nr:asparaginase [Clostridia bacterium]